MDSAAARQRDFPRTGFTFCHEGSYLGRHSPKNLTKWVTPGSPFSCPGLDLRASLESCRGFFPAVRFWQVALVVPKGPALCGVSRFRWNRERAASPVVGPCQVGKIRSQAPRALVTSGGDPNPAAKRTCFLAFRKIRPLVSPPRIGASGPDSGPVPKVAPDVVPDRFRGHGPLRRKRSDRLERSFAVGGYPSTVFPKMNDPVRESRRQPLTPMPGSGRKRKSWGPAPDG